MECRDRRGASSDTVREQRQRLRSAIIDTHDRSCIDNPNTIHVFGFDDEGHLQGWRSSRSSLPATASGCRKTLGQRSAMTMSKSTAISSFTFTVPPAMLMGVIANSLCRSVVEPL